MDNEKFREEVYKKYEYYKTQKKNSFYNKNQYNKKTNLTLTLNCIASFIIACITITGIAYATTQYVKNAENKKIWKEPEKYDYEAEKNVTEKDIKESISEEEAKKIGIESLKKLNIEIGNITSSELNKAPWLDEIKWIIKTDRDLVIEINAKNGKIDTIENNSIFNENRNSKTEKEATEIAKEIAQEICEKLSFSKNYGLVYIYSLGGGKWSADFSATYDGIANDYQTIRFIFFPATKEIILLKIFDYDFENNPFEITEEEAIEIAKKRHAEDNIKDILIEKDIRQMNEMVFLKENPPEYGEHYRTENIVRNVWNVTIIEQEYDIRDIYYVDATTGEIIGGGGPK